MEAHRMAEQNAEQTKESTIGIEKDVLGCMIRDQSIIPNVAQYIKADDFSSPRTRVIFEKLIELDAAKASIDQEIVSRSMGSSPEVAILVSECVDRIASGSNWKYYTDWLKDHSLDRQWKMFLRTELESQDQSIPIIERISDGASRIIKLSDASGGSGIMNIRDYIPGVLANIEDAYRRGGKMIGSDSGLEPINECAQGVRKEFIVIGARPSIGKSALAAQIGLHLAKEVNEPVGYFSLEMRDIDLVKRMLAGISGISASKLDSGFLKQADFTKIQDSLGFLYASKFSDPGVELPVPFYMVDSTKDLNEMVAKSRYMVRKLGVKHLFFDHMSLIKFRGSERMDPVSVMTVIANTLQDLQRELGCSVIALAQLSRDSESTKNPNARPTIADLRGSGTVEQNADQIWLMHRNRKDKGLSKTDVDIAKGRNGGNGIAHLLFDTECVRFIKDPNPPIENA